MGVARAKSTTNNPTLRVSKALRSTPELAAFFGEYGCPFRHSSDRVCIHVHRDDGAFARAAVAQPPPHGGLS